MTVVSEALDNTNFIFSNIYFTILLGVTTLLTLYHFWFQSLRYVKLAKTIPGPRPLPILGNVLEGVGLNPNAAMKKVLSVTNDYEGDVARIFFGPFLYIVLRNPEDIELILGSQEHLEKSREYKYFEPWLGDGLLISKGDRWKHHRKMIAPTFHSSILKSFFPVFNKNAKKLLAQLDKHKGQVFDCHDYMSGTTVDTLLETAMGVERTHKDSKGFEYAKAVMDMCNILHLRHYKFWLRPDFIFKWTKLAKTQEKLLEIIHNLTREVIKRKKIDYFSRVKKGENSLYKEAVKVEEQSENIKTENYKYIHDDLEDIEDKDIGEKKRLAFLDFMIEASQIPGNNLSDEDIKEEVDTIMFEGHDTTAAGSSFVLCLLGVHKNIQDACVNELKEIFHDDWSRPITFTDTLQMKYLERVIMETLRMYPPVPIISRKVRKDVKLASANYIIPADSVVLISQYLTHRHEQHWKNPHVFNPDNFLPENCQNRHYYSYIPFSAGPRSCVGRKYAMLKLKVILASVLRKYQITSPNKESEFELQADIILKRTDGFNIIIEDRVL
ncbi:cytochrome P450 4g1-like [Sitophilus oryzae]|uniref:Cytochrome P450 4g1-like n=1 Tax=Sitophilus oryzae TaxID=7048 RepID=A0A6J2XJF0_SITOR|nr:cytochrome P450 4g1-like [Sitophilus oryzae]QTM97444.1 Cytochrome P450 [Sitophilus oryzae]